jgi:hypothetical protein
MAAEFAFKIKPERITVSSPEAGFSRTVKAVFSQDKSDIRFEIEII